jgi:predicted secreted protein
MTIVFGTVLYIMIWWITLFAVLPFGVKTQGEAGEVVEGTPESAPASPRFWRVVLINTVVSAVVFTVVWAAMQNDWLGLREIPVGYTDPASLTTPPNGGTAAP